MTMLDQMRRHKGWLKWSLGAVVVTFILLYIPSFLKNPGAAGVNDVIATVDGREVKAGDFQIAYQQRLQAYRAQFGGTLTDEMIQQLGIKPRLIAEMENEEAVLVEAGRRGLTVTDGELKQRILRMPGFQENGRWIGDARYVQILQMQRPPMRSDQFEDKLRRNFLAEKLQAAIGGWIRVTDAEVEKEYRERNEKVKADLAIFTANQFRTGLQATDAEASAYFASHQESYRMPEKRRIRFLSVDAQALRPKMSVTDTEIADRYRRDQTQYSSPEQVRASHILFKTEGKDDATVKKLAESVLVKAKAKGADFAALAKQYSEDSSKDQGGDVNYFQREGMVKPFSDAAFAGKPGEITDLVKSQYGYHIIKVGDKKAPSTKTLAEVRPQIAEQIRWEKAQVEAQTLADAIAPQIKTPGDLDTVARARGLSVGDSGLFARSEPMAGLGFAPGVVAEAFQMVMGTVSTALRTDQGYAFATLAEVKAPYLPQLDEVKDKVKDDVIRTKAIDVAKAKAAALASAAANKGNFAALAKTAGVTVKTTESIPRNSAYPEIGVSSAIDDALFALETGGVTRPISTDTAVVVARVSEKQAMTPAGFQAERDTLRQQLLQQRRQEFFNAYMAKAQKTMEIKENPDVKKLVLGR